MYYYGINDPYYDPMQTAEAWQKCYDFCSSLNNLNPNSPYEMEYVFFKAMDFRMACDKLPYQQQTMLKNSALSALLAKFVALGNSKC